MPDILDGDGGKPQESVGNGNDTHNRYPVDQVVHHSFRLGGKTNDNRNTPGAGKQRKCKGAEGDIFFLKCRSEERRVGKEERCVRIVVSEQVRMVYRCSASIVSRLGLSS